MVTKLSSCFLDFCKIKFQALQRDDRKVASLIVNKAILAILLKMSLEVVIILLKQIHVVFNITMSQELLATLC